MTSKLSSFSKVGGAHGITDLLITIYSHNLPKVHFAGYISMLFLKYCHLNKNSWKNSTSAGWAEFDQICGPFFIWDLTAALEDDECLTLEGYNDMIQRYVKLSRSVPFWPAESTHTP